jgi:hypothetical protein
MGSVDHTHPALADSLRVQEGRCDEQSLDQNDTERRFRHTIPPKSASIVAPRVGLIAGDCPASALCCLS